MYANVKNYNPAREVLSMAIDLDGTSAKAYYWWGMVQLQIKRYNAACEDMRIAMSLGWPPEQIPEFCR